MLFKMLIASTAASTCAGVMVLCLWFPKWFRCLECDWEQGYPDDDIEGEVLYADPFKKHHYCYAEEAVEKNDSE